MGRAIRRFDFFLAFLALLIFLVNFAAVSLKLVDQRHFRLAHDRQRHGL